MSSSLLIRNLPKEVKTELRVRAARNGRSMEEEARVILAAALAPHDKRTPDGQPWSLWDATRRIFGPENGVELELSPRELVRDPPDFSWVLDEPDEAGAEEDGPVPPKSDR